ncbi:MAG: MogA/MoaB family molybdenum cofactor biosynthesis protein [Anaerolineae bacterium]|nr:MogA/MoaB family molybdenum cofactor biosynthesis protein [Anaerolineae bacterium]
MFSKPRRGIVLVRAAVVTVSDRCFAGEREDRSGPLLADLLRGQGVELVAAELVPDEEDRIEAVLASLCARGDVDVIVTTGGTGLAPRDRTPEATRRIIDREAPGLAEMLRWQGHERTPRAVLSRGIAGLRGRCLIINLAGSTGAVRDGVEILAPVLGHAVQMARGENLDHGSSRND